MTLTQHRGSLVAPDGQRARKGLLSFSRAPLLLFVVGVVFAIIAWRNPLLHKVFLDLSHAGYLGVFIAGIMYGSSFTSTAASIVFAHLPESMNIFLVGIVGATGAMVYDLTVFILVRRISHKSFFTNIISRWHRRIIPRWLSVVLGAIIIASPLPDELAAGLLSLESVSRRRFAVMSFVGNMVGIMIIDALF